MEQIRLTIDACVNNSSEDNTHDALFFYIRIVKDRNKKDVRQEYHHSIILVK